MIQTVVCFPQRILNKLPLVAGRLVPGPIPASKEVIDLLSPHGNGYNILKLAWL
jgi:hypothetical protein